MALYELRTYTLYVGKMAEATKLYQELASSEAAGLVFHCSRIGEVKNGQNNSI